MTWYTANKRLITYILSEYTHTIGHFFSLHVFSLTGGLFAPEQYLLSTILTLLPSIWIQRDGFLLVIPPPQTAEQGPHGPCIQPYDPLWGFLINLVFAVSLLFSGNVYLYLIPKLKSWNSTCRLEINAFTQDDDKLMIVLPNNRRFVCIHSEVNILKKGIYERLEK